MEKSVNGTITRYVYDNEDILFEYNNSGALAAKYTHGAGTDEPLSVDMLGKYYYYHADSLGSITTITDARGKSVQKYTYSEFGALKQSTTFIQPYSFTGREYDQETGLYYYRARYYDANTGRFISKDPIGFESGDTNHYRYVFNNPVNAIDPWGLKGERYEICEKWSTVGRWLCKKYVNWGCSGSKGAYCCEVDLKRCLQKVDQCDSEYEKKSQQCYAESVMCNAGLK